MDLSPCASKKTCSCDRLLRSHAASALGCLRAQRDMFHRKDCCDLALPPRWMFFNCGHQIPFPHSSAHTSLTLSGTRDPKPRSLRLCFTDCRPHTRIRCWGIINIILVIFEKYDIYIYILLLASILFTVTVGTITSSKQTRQTKLDLRLVCGRKLCSFWWCYLCS